MEKIERNFKNNNSRNAWQGMNTILGRQQNQTACIPSNEHDKQTYVNKLNEFYARFDCYDFSENISLPSLSVSLCCLRAVYLRLL